MSGKTTVNISKKKTTLINGKTGEVLEQSSGDQKSDLDRRREQRAKRLGLKV